MYAAFLLNRLLGLFTKRRCIPNLQIKRMDMEARSLPADKATQLLNKVKEYKADLVNLREQLKKAAAAAPTGDAARAELVRDMHLHLL